ncbi:MAG TPA: dATP/dGTP pyrophosphohydrolase domain-containing protein [Chitinophagaceae bacterium]|nr:dATP/dGTP pyrophosphohydrolase domain-containing protein [Chitinophagaceae bacterium]
MKKSEFIARLQDIPGDPEVAIYDGLRNLHEDTGEDEGTSAGIYPGFRIEFFDDATVPENGEPFIGLCFDNDFFPEEGSDHFHTVASEWQSWSSQTFEKATALSSLRKLLKEVEELKTAILEGHPTPQQLDEYADCFMCLLHSAAQSGFNVADLTVGIKAKVEVNYERIWIHNKLDNTYSHKK